MELRPWLAVISRPRHWLRVTATSGWAPRAAQTGPSCRGERGRHPAVTEQIRKHSNSQKSLKFPEMPLRVGFPSKRTQPGGRAHVGSTAAARCGGGLAFRHFSPHAARHRRFLVQRAGVCLARSRNLGFSGVIGCVGERVLDYIRFFTEPSKVIFASCCFRTVGFCQV